MNKDFTYKLTTSFSNERLDAYRQKIGSPSDLEVFCYYTWNMVLSESLYSSLQILEISLRNTIHNAVSERCHRMDWYDDKTIVSSPNDINALNKAKRVLRSGKKALEPNRVIAELNFGFWTSLLDKRYEQILWPVLLKQCFSEMPRTTRTRKNISKRFQAIRRLRNRIFHHEPIWYWQDLSQKHADIIEAIGWIEPAAKELALSIDRFEDTYNNGFREIENKLKNKFC